jgi:hypothetical protein
MGRRNRDTDSRIAQLDLRLPRSDGWDFPAMTVVLLRIESMGELRPGVGKTPHAQHLYLNPKFLLKHVQVKIMQLA